MNAQDHDRADSISPDTDGEYRSLLGRREHIFEIRVKGHLGSQWSDWLGGLDMRLLDNGDMILSGPIADQAALMGILNKLVGLNLALLSLREVEPERLEEP